MKVRISLALFLLCSSTFAQQVITVEDAVSTALQKNFDVRLQQNDAAGASTAANNSFGVFLPDLNASGTRIWNKNDQRQILANNTEVERKGIPSNNLTGTVQLSWTVFDGLRMFATRSRLQELEQIGEWTVKAQMITTMADVIGNYYSIVAEKQQLKAINEQISVGEERVKLAERKLQVGTGGKPELLQAKVDQNAFKVAAIQQEAVIQQLKEQLNGALGLSLPETFEVSDSIPLNLQLTLDEIVQGIEETNPVLVAARKNMEVARFALKERRGERYPVVNLVSNYNFNRTKNQVAINSFTTLFNQNKGYNYGVTATLPILNNLVTRNAVQLATIEVERAKLTYDQARMNALVGVRVAYANYDNARKALVIEEENVLLARENVSIILESFRRGVATFIELRTAQQSMVDASTRLATARYNAKISETELLRLKGSLLK